MADQSRAEGGPWLTLGISGLGHWLTRVAGQLGERARARNFEGREAAIQASVSLSRIGASGSQPPARNASPLQFNQSFQKPPIRQNIRQVVLQY